LAGVQLSSAKNTVEAAVRVIPTQALIKNLKYRYNE
jgi:hypothetical protein